MNIYIESIGVISRAAMSPEQLLQLAGGEQTGPLPLPLAFPSSIPPAKLRRNSRYNKMACAAADQAISVLQSDENADMHRFGSILSTGYGAAEYSSVFADSVVKGDPSACSPAIFSGSVPNSCLGTICILNQLKGPSTMLAGGDPLEYAALLLQTNRADRILAGSVEEYFLPLYDSVASVPGMKDCDLSEGAAMAVLSRESSDHVWCKITDFHNCSLSDSPYLHEVPDCRDSLSGVLRRFETPDAVFAAANGTAFDSEETAAIQSVFPDADILQPKKIFGETLGCGYMMNVLYAAACIRAGRYRRILVTGLDMIGNYTCALLE